MPPRTTTLTTAAMICLAAPAMALEVGRCNIAQDGAFRTVLLVRHDGQTHVHRAGDNGLRRAMMFDPKGAAAWAEDHYGAGPASAIAACGNIGSGNGFAAVAAPGPTGGGNPTTSEPPTGNDSGSGGSDSETQL